MPLTPQDVDNKRFTAVKRKEGYDMAEVDEFLDEVKAELERLTKDNDSLRGGASTSAPAATAPQAAGQTAETPKVASVGEASSAAARLLEIATRNADQLVGEAKDEADKILGEARTKAERLDVESKQRADRVEADARSRSELLETETAERRASLFGDLEREKDRLGTEVENLRSFEREYRSRLRSYFTDQLAALDGDGTAAPAQDGQPKPAQSQPSRLQSLLGHDNG